MVNCNPETVSTDYDTSDRLYFEPLTLEDVLEIVHAEPQAGPVAGVIVQLGGQTPLGLAQALKDNGVPIVGTSPEAIHLAEDRGAFGRVLAEAGLPAPKHGTATSFPAGQGHRRRDRLPGPGPPLLRARRARHGDRLRRGPRWRPTSPSPPRSARPARCWSTASSTTPSRSTSTRSTTATELYLGGVMEHIEEAGIHSGDSACALPPITLGGYDIKRLRASTEAIAARRRRPRPDQHPVRAGRRHPLRPGGQPARLPDRALHLQGDGRAAGQGRRPHLARRHRRRTARRGPAARPTGDGGTLPLDAPISVKEAVLPWTPLPRRPGPRRRHRPRPGDALHRRGHGHRRGLRHRLRQVAGRRLRGAAHQGPRLRLGRQPRQALADLPGPRTGRARLRTARHLRHRGGAAAQRHRRHGSCASRARARAPTASRPSSSSSTTARST